jgi:YVTN family beta-propeller protein
MAELPTGTVTFLFTDIEGSTRLERELRERYGEVLAEHQRLLRAAFSAHGGHEVDTQGDSFFFVFPRAKAAVEAAVEAQRALASYPWPEGGEVRVRIGINTGEASLEDGRYVGFPVHRAARISAAGHGGQILLSSSTRELVEHDLPQDQLVRDLGERRLKDLPRPERIYQLVVDGLPSEFAPLRTLDEQELAEAARAALTRRRYRRRIAFVIPAAVLVGAAIVAAFFLTRGSGGITVEPNSVAIIDPEKNAVVDTVLVGAMPGPVVVGEGSVWVANLQDRNLARIDAARRSVVRRIALEATPTGLAVGEGAVWIVYGRLGTVSSVDPQFNVVGEPIDPGLPSARGSVAVGNGAIWVAFDTSFLVRLDPASRRVVATGVVSGDGSSAIAVGEESVWVASAVGSTVSRLNPRTAAEFSQFTVGREPSAIAVGGGAVWVANKGDDTVSRIDPNSGSQTPIAVGDGPAGIAFGEGAVWVANSAAGTVSRIDPAADQVTATIDLGSRPEGVAVGNGAVWVTVQAP